MLLKACELKYDISKLKMKEKPYFIAVNIIDNALYQIRDKIKELQRNRKNYYKKITYLIIILNLSIIIFRDLLLSVL